MNKDNRDLQINVLLTFLNAIFYTLRTSYMKFEFLSAFYKGCYPYYQRMCEDGLVFDIDYSKFSNLFNALEEIKKTNDVC